MSLIRNTTLVNSTAWAMDGVPYLPTNIDCTPLQSQNYVKDWEA